MMFPIRLTAPFAADVHAGIGVEGYEKHDDVEGGWVGGGVDVCDGFGEGGFFLAGGEYVGGGEDADG